MYVMVNEWINANGEREKAATFFATSDFAAAKQIFEEERDEIESEGDSLRGVSENVRLYKMDMIDSSNTKLG